MRTLLLTNNDCYKRGVSMKPKGIMLHSTGADNPTLKRYVGPDDGILGENIYDNHWNHSGLDVCVHAFIGETKNGSVECYQTLPWQMRGWHCGSDANDTHISIELCEDDLEDRVYFQKVYQTAIGVCVELCKKFNLNPNAPGVLIDHAEGHALGIASNHGDVGHWFQRQGKTMNDFRHEVAKRLNEPQQEVIPAWAKPTIDKLVASGALKGTGTGLNLSNDLMRTLVVLDRLGIF